MLRPCPLALAMWILIWLALPQKKKLKSTGVLLKGIISLLHEGVKYL